MRTSCWEAFLLDWNPAGVDGSRIGPDEVMELLSATSEDAATRAYWRLDGVVCANGITYGVALPVTQMILATLPSCSFPARRRALELLGQIAVGEPDAASPDVVLECGAELRQSAWYLIHGLQFDSLELVWLYVDLVGVLGEAYADFNERARKYLERVLSRDLPASDRELVQNTISAL